MTDAILFAGQVAGFVAIVVLLSILLFEAVFGAAIPAGVGAVILTYGGAHAVNRVRGDPA